MFISTGRTVVSRSNWWAQAFQNRLIAMVLVMVVFVPLIGVPADIEVRGIVTVSFEGLAILLATMLLWNAELNLRRDKVVAFLRTSANLPILLLLVWSVVRCSFAPYKAYGVQNVLQLAAGILLYFVVGYQFRQSKHLSLLVDTLLFLAIAVSICATAQYAVTPEFRGTALFGNQQPLGSLLMILLPIVASVAISDKRPIRQLVAQATAVLTAGALMLAQTRSAWFGALLGLGVVGMLAWKVSSKDKAGLTPSHGLATQKHKFVLPAIMIIASLGFVVAMMRQNSGTAGRIVTLAHVSRIESFHERLGLWRGAIGMIKDHPFFGVGPGLYPVEQYAYTGFGATIISDGKRVGVITLASQAHNFYLQTAAELGLPGITIMIAVLVAFVVSAARRVPQMDDGIRRTLLIASMGSVAAFAVDAASSPSWQFGQITMFLWLVMGIGLSCLRPRA